MKDRGERRGKDGRMMKMKGRGKMKTMEKEDVGCGQRYIERGDTKEREIRLMKSVKVWSRNNILLPFWIKFRLKKRISCSASLDRSF